MTRTTLAIAVLLGISTANGAILYDNGGPDTVPPQTGLPITFFTTADDFKLVTSSTIQSVAFYLQADNGIATWSQNVNYTFLSDASGVPGSILASGTAQNVVKTDSGLAWCCSQEHAYLVTFNLQSGFVANAGITYWLQLSGATTTSGSAYWVTTGGGAGTNPAFYAGSNTSGRQVAFNLSGTPLSGTQSPEPTSLALGGAGFVSLVLVRRRLSAK